MTENAGFPAPGAPRPAGNAPTACTAPCPAACAVLPQSAVAAYAAGGLDPVTAWSVETHLPGCPACRAALGGHVSAARLARNRAVLLTRAALPEQGRAERLLARLGVPPSLWRLLAVTPSLRGPWLACVALVLGVTVGAAWLFGTAAGAHLLGGPPGGGWPAGSAGGAGRSGFAGGGPLLGGGGPPGGRAFALLPFLLLAPLLPLAGVAVAFDRRFDPSRDILAAAPVSGMRLFLARAVAVIGAALLPAMALALVLPASPWTSLLIAPPALAVSSLGLALSTAMPPLRAASWAAAGWIAAVAVLMSLRSSPGLVFGPGTQLTACCVIVVAACVLRARRRSLGLA